MEQDKRGLCPYDDKRYLLADLPTTLLIQTLTPMVITNSRPRRMWRWTCLSVQGLNSSLSSASHHQSTTRTPFRPDPQQTTLLVLNRELRFKRKNTRVAKLLSKRNRRDSNGEEIGGEEFEQVPDGDENGELDGAQLRRAERAAAARPGAAIRMGDVIEQIIARQHLRMPESPPKRMPMLLPQPSPQRAGMS